MYRFCSHQHAKHWSHFHHPDQPKPSAAQDDPSVTQCPHDGTCTNETPDRWQQFRYRCQRFPLPGPNAKLWCDAYHATSEDSAQIIVSSKTFKLGNQFALMGSGIYFAYSEAAALVKAFSKGRVLKCKVFMGRQAIVKKQGADKSMTWEKLHSAGYRSIRITGLPTGDEIVVYCPEQVRDITLLPKSAP
jgi:hypothetical protein